MITHAKADDSDLAVLEQLQYKFGRLSQSPEAQSRGCKRFCEYINTVLEDVVKVWRVVMRKVKMRQVRFVRRNQAMGFTVWGHEVHGVYSMGS